jgi:hypothetical protein
MPEVKDRVIQVHIEDTFFAILTKDIYGKQSVSSYVRTLIIEDLLKRGKIDADLATKILLGKVPSL